MSARNINLGDQVITCLSEETLLDALLRNDITIPFGCRQGACQSCMIRSLDVAPPVEAQVGLKDVQQKQNYFLACKCHPAQDMSISLGKLLSFFNSATVVGKELLNEETILLTIECQTPLDFYAGQFVNLRRADGLMRSYSIANSRLHAQYLTFHIRRLPGGYFSEWAHRELQLGDTLAVSEPQGFCFYLPDRLEQNLLLIGTGSGLAPLAGIIHEALQQGHIGQIHLYHGSRNMAGLYWIDKMRALESQYANFHYTPCVSAESVQDATRGRANDVALRDLPNLKQWRIFLCGHPDMVNQSKMQVFLAGAKMDDIYSDAFHVTPAMRG